MTVLRRLDAVLEPSKQAVLEMKKSLDKAKITNQDQALRQAAGHAGRAKAFYASAVMTLALGMAGAIVMFTLVRGILLRPLPVPDEDRLVVSWRVPRSGLATHVPYRSADVDEIGRGSRSFEKIAGVGYNGAFEQDWRLGDAWITAKTVAVMGGFFDVARLAVAGAIAGLVLAFAATRVLHGLLFETEPLDPVSLVAAALVLVGAAVVATWLPARRAMRVDPIEVLRAQ